MKFFTHSLIACVAAGVLAVGWAPLQAQERPSAPPPGAQDGPSNDRQDGPPGGGPRPPGGPSGQGQRPPRFDQQDGPPGQGGPGGTGQDRSGQGGGQPGGPRPQDGGRGQGQPPEIARFNAYLSMVDSYSKLARDPDASGVAAVVSAADVLRSKGPQAAIDFFNKMLPDVKSDTVRRAIRLQLIDLYKASNQPDKALEQLQTLITAATGESASKQP